MCPGAPEPGTSTPKINGIDIHSNWNGTAADTDINVATLVEGLDEGREIAAADITEYNGMNFDEAV